LATTIADHVAGTLGQPVLFWSLEMSDKENLERVVCGRARVDSSRMRNGYATEREIKAFTVATSQIAKSPLKIIATGQPKLAQLLSRTRQEVQRHGFKLVIVDYLGLIDLGEKNRSRYEEITKISGALKALAMELQVPVIALCQLNRDSDRENRKPHMADLRDSGAIEQDADIVLLLHPNPDDAGDLQRVELIVAKHRGGRTGGINLVFHRQWTRFDSATK
jgi:replicative DNA helicase